MTAEVPIPLPENAMPLPTQDGQASDRECPFVSKNGPECPMCGAPPTKVNIDEAGGYGHCDDCGEKFPLKRRRR